MLLKINLKHRFYFNVEFALLLFVIPLHHHPIPQHLKHISKVWAVARSPTNQAGVCPHILTCSEKDDFPVLGRLRIPRQWKFAPGQASGRARRQWQEGRRAGAHFHQEVAMVAGHWRFSRVLPGGVSTGENSLTNAITTPTPPPQKVSINYLWLSSPISYTRIY